MAGSVSERALLFGMIRPLRSCPDTFGCVHVHFDDTAPPAPDPTLGGALNAMPEHVDEDDHTRLTLTIPQAADLLGISLSKAYEAARLAQIPTIRLGTRILVSRRRLEDIVNGSAQ
jgi:excisionase family DNA binding protein